MTEIIVSTEAISEHIHTRLRDYNAKYLHDYAEHSYHIRSGESIVAGIVATRLFDSMEVDFLFVEEEYRGQGLGARLLRHVEDIAREQGLKRVLLNTYSFQAPEFYRKQGYKEMLRLDPCCGPYSQSFFLKEL